MGRGVGRYEKGEKAEFKGSFVKPASTVGNDCLTLQGSGRNNTSLRDLWGSYSICPKAIVELVRLPSFSKLIWESFPFLMFCSRCLFNVVQQPLLCCTWLNPRTWIWLQCFIWCTTKQPARKILYSSWLSVCFCFFIYHLSTGDKTCQVYLTGIKWDLTSKYDNAHLECTGYCSHHCGKIPYRSNLKEIFMLAHGFRGYHPLS